jgi:hypothetical protein
MVNLRDVRTALQGAWRLARLDRGGMANFDRSEAGLWRSFSVYAIIFPAFLLLLALHLDETQTNLPRLFLVESIGYVISCAAFPLLMLPVARFLGREHLWADFIIAYNWAQILEYILFLVTEGFAGSGILPDALAIGIAPTVFIAVLLYEWFIARVALDVGAAAATMVVLLNLVFGLLVSRVCDALH